MAPSAPFVRAMIDLAAPRPDGIRPINLEIGATGIGDEDGIGPGLAIGEGGRSDALGLSSEPLD